MAAEALSVQVACLYILDYKGVWLYPHGCWHKPEHISLSFSPENIKSGTGMIPLAAQATKGHVIQYSNLKHASNHFAVTDALATPVYGGTTLMGVLLVADKHPSGEFSSADEQKLSDFAADPQHIITIQNFWIQLQQTQRDKELNVISRMSQAVTSPASLSDIKSVCFCHSRPALPERAVCI
jgi:hypothetical protein